MGRDGEEVSFEGVVARVTFENPTSAFRVIKVNVEGRAEPVAVVGSFAPVAAGVRVRVHGRVVSDAKHGPQVAADAVTELKPTTLAAIERYLGSGLIKGIGDVYAKRIVATFGTDTLRVLDEEPERLDEVDGLGHKRAHRVREAWAEQRGVREVMVLLQAHGGSPALAARIWKRYGPRATAIVATDPYRLALDVWGVGFRTADAIATSLGVAKDSPARMQAAVLQVLSDVTTEGHVFTSHHDVRSAAATLVGEDPFDSAVRERIDGAIVALCASRYVVREGSGDDARLYTAALYDAEVRLAATVVQLVRDGSRRLEGAEAAMGRFETGTGVALADEQRAAIERAAKERIVVVTGGPGVGKTTIVRALVHLFASAKLSVALAAPTGRAAKRMAEACGQESLTLHRLLEFEPKKNAFRRNRQRPVDADALIVDEVSMLDLPLADALLDALGAHTRIVLVGDVDQLPSVGPGAVLRDILASRSVPSVRLTQIFRQARSSRIVTNAHRILEGEELEVGERGDASSDFFWVKCHDADRARDTVIELVRDRIPKRFGFDPILDIQVLAPMHRGPAGTTALNEALQAALNPHAPGLVRGGRALRVGDKVMQLRNNYDRNVFNGDVGFVIGVDDEARSLTVGFDPNGKGDFERTVPYDGSSLDELTLAYACSVHKSQGSEYPVVVIPFLTSHFVMLSRNLLYTAVTRGKKLVVLVADPRAVRLALTSERNDERRSCLGERIAQAEAVA
jgi:exodeoxyribonuclease V alpha subunit